MDTRSDQPLISARILLYPLSPEMIQVLVRLAPAKRRLSTQPTVTINIDPDFCTAEHWGIL